MDIINLLATTGSKAPPAGKPDGGAGQGADFASVLQTATGAGHAAKGLTLLAASGATVAAHAKDEAGKALQAKLDPADLLASKDAKADGKGVPKSDAKDAKKPDAKDTQKKAKKDDHDHKCTQQAAVQVPAPVAATPLLAAAAASQAGDVAGKNTLARSDKTDAAPGKVADANARGGTRHQLQQLQQTGLTAASSAASGHAGPDTGASSGGHGFAAQLLSAADAPAQASPTAPSHVGDGATTSAINGLGLVNAPVAPQAATHANAPAPVYTATLQASVGSAPWQNELGQQLIRFSQRGEHQIELHLHPNELGPLQISLHVNDQVAQAHFFAAHAQVRDAVQQAIPQLREALAGQGIALGEAMVGQQQQQRQGSGSSPRSGVSSPLAVTGVEAEGVAPLRTGLIPARVAAGGVDLYA